MAAKDFSENLLRMVAGELYFANCMTAAREMFGKSYFSLGAAEKGAVDRTVFEVSRGCYQMMSPENLAGQTKPEPIGFPMAPQTGQT